MPQARNLLVKQPHPDLPSFRTTKFQHHLTCQYTLVRTIFAPWAVKPAPLYLHW